MTYIDDIELVNDAAVWNPPPNPAPPPKPSDAITIELVRPKGHYYLATVPDTLDLAERARLAVHGMTASLDPAMNYAPWGHVFFGNPTPCFMDRSGGPPKWGIARLGLFGEMCTTGDMTQLALKLSDAGVGDYYEDVDGYVRNQLTEMQITRPDLLREAAQTLHGIPDYNDGDASDTVNRIVGTYFSDSGSPARIPQVRMYYTICCTGNCIPALHYAWESIVRCHDGFAKVNLLLNRASPWLDIDSYLHRSGPFLVQPQSDGLYDDLQGQHLGRYYATGGRGGLPTLPARSGA